MMRHLPFTVFRRVGRRFYSVKFKNEAGEYLSAISIGQETQAAAIATAFEWLKNGVPRKTGTISLPVLALLKNTETSSADCEAICKALQQRGLLQSFTLAKTRAAVSFPDFIQTFWDYDKSPYVREKLRKKHGIHKNYTVGQLLVTVKYWVPFFYGRVLGDISRADIERFIDSLEGAKLSAARKNMIIRAGLIPLRWAHNKDMTDRDVTRGHTMYSGKARERQILSPELMAAVFRVEWVDRRSQLANMLAAISGLRAGEIRALQVRDLGRDCLYVKHSYNDRDKLKTTKTNEPRSVEVFPALIDELMTLAKENPHGAGMESYIFWAEHKADKPIEERLLLTGLREALQKTGMGKATAAGYVFHGWRHFYATHMRGYLDTRLLKSQTGHKTTAMLEHYSEHGRGNDRETIQAAQRAVYGGLLPFATGVSVL